MKTLFCCLFLTTYYGATRADEPATVEEARGVFDLAELPAPANLVSESARNLAAWSFVVKASVTGAYGEQKQELIKRGWKELPNGYVSDQTASGTFEKQGYRLSLSVFPSATKGTVAVSCLNHGNVETKTLPVPPGTKVFFSGPVSTLLLSEGTVDATASACHDLLLQQGWQPYGTAGDSRFYKQNAVKLNARVASAPAQGGKTLIEYSTELMSADLPAPSETLRASYADVTKELSFDTKSDSGAIVAFYREILGQSGWKPTTEAVVKNRSTESLLFLNPQNDLLTLSMRPVEDLLRVSLKHRSAAEIKKLAETAAKMKESTRKAAAKPEIAIRLPDGAKEKKALPGDLSFQIPVGQAKAAAIAIVNELGKDGWKAAEAPTLESAAGVVLLGKDSMSLSITYTDTGFGDAELSLSGIGVALVKAK